MTYDHARPPAPCIAWFEPVEGRALRKTSCQCGVFLYTGTSREVKSVDPFPAKNLPTQGVSPDHLAERVQTRLQ
jgi:hypothetical protein